MSDRNVSVILFLVFLSTLAFIFAPVFNGRLLINDDLDIAIPEDRPLPIGPGSMQFRNNDTGEICKVPL